MKRLGVLSATTATLTAGKRSCLAASSRARFIAHQIPVSSLGTLPQVFCCLMGKPFSLPYSCAGKSRIQRCLLLEISHGWTLLLSVRSRAIRFRPSTRSSSSATTALVIWNSTFERSSSPPTRRPSSSSISLLAARTSFNLPMKKPKVTSLMCLMRRSRPPYYILTSSIGG